MKQINPTFAIQIYDPSHFEKLKSIHDASQIFPGVFEGKNGTFFSDFQQNQHFLKFSTQGITPFKDFMFGISEDERSAFVGCF
jgi:hypothetical protein